MTKFKVRFAQTVYYENTIKASSRSEAIKKALDILDGDDPDFVEVDSTDFWLESVDDEPALALRW